VRSATRSRVTHIRRKPRRLALTTVQVSGVGDSEIGDLLLYDGQVALPAGVGGVGGGAGLDLLVDRFQLASGGGQVPDAGQCLDFKVSDQDPGPLCRGMNGPISAR